MSRSKAFKLAELIRHMEYDSTDDVIKTEKATQDKTRRGVLQVNPLLQNLILIPLQRQITEQQDTLLQCLREHLFTQLKS